jgi:hypothetical protein
MNTLRSWLFRGSVIAVAGLMVASWLLPWWGSWSLQIGHYDVVQIFPYGLRTNLGGWASLIQGFSEMPAWFSPLMWLYLGLCMAGLAFALWKMNKNVRLVGRNFNLSRLLIGIIGFSYVMVIIIFYFYAKMRVEAAGIHFIGESYMVMGIAGKTYVFSGFRNGLYMACAVGPLFLILALLRNQITGKTKNVASVEAGA